MPYKDSPHIREEIVYIVKVANKTFHLTEEPIDENLKGGIALLISPAIRGLNLTSLCIEELDALERIITLAFKKARPICEELDAGAQQAANSGDLRFRRLYRPVPIEIDLQNVPIPEPKEKQPDADKNESEGLS